MYPHILYVYIDMCISTYMCRYIYVYITGIGMLNVFPHYAFFAVHRKDIILRLAFSSLLLSLTLD